MPELFHISALLKTLQPVPDASWWEELARLCAQGVDVAKVRGKNNKTVTEALVGLIIKEEERTQAHAQAIMRLHQMVGTPLSTTVWRDLLLRAPESKMRAQPEFYSTLLKEAAIPAIQNGQRTLDGLFLMTAFICDRLDLVEELVEQGVSYAASGGTWPALAHGSQRAWSHMTQRLDPRELGQSLAGKLPWWHILVLAQEGDISKTARQWGQTHEPQALDVLDLGLLNKSIKAAMNQGDVIEQLLESRSDWRTARLPGKQQTPLWHLAFAEAPEKVMGLLEQSDTRVEWSDVDATGDDVWAYWLQQADGSSHSLPRKTIKALGARYAPCIKEGGWLERSITPTFLLSQQGVQGLIKMVGTRTEVWWGANETHQNLIAERLPHLLNNLFNQNVKTATKSLLAIVESTDFSALTPTLRYSLVLHEQFRPGGPSRRVVDQCKKHGVELSDKVLDSFTRFHPEYAQHMRIIHQEMALDKAWGAAQPTNGRKLRM